MRAVIIVQVGYKLSCAFKFLYSSINIRFEIPNIYFQAEDIRQPAVKRDIMKIMTLGEAMLLTIYRIL